MKTTFCFSVIMYVMTTACGQLTVEKGDTKVTWSDTEQEQGIDSKEESEEPVFSLVIPECSTIESQSLFMNDGLTHVVMAQCDARTELHRITTTQDLELIDSQRIDSCLSVKEFKANKDFNSIEITCELGNEESVEIDEETKVAELTTLTDLAAQLPESLKNINQAFINSDNIYTISSTDPYPFTCARQQIGFIKETKPITFKNGFSSNDRILANAKHYLRWDSLTSSFEFGFFENCAPIKIKNLIDILPTSMDLKEFNTVGETIVALTVQTSAQILYISSDDQTSQKQFDKDLPIHIEAMNNKILVNNAEHLMIIEN